MNLRYKLFVMATSLFSFNALAQPFFMNKQTRPCNQAFMQTILKVNQPVPVDGWDRGEMIYNSILASIAKGQCLELTDLQNHKVSYVTVHKGQQDIYTLLTLDSNYKIKDFVDIGL